MINNNNNESKYNLIIQTMAKDEEHIINEWIVNQEIPTHELTELITYIKNKDGYIISPNISIRNGPKGYYIFYKTAKMTKPKFYNCDEIIELIENKDTDKISTYIEKKYNLL